MAEKNKKILLTGGGTTGHVAVNLALIPELKKEGYEIYYMGSKKGIEKDLISAFDYVKYIPISTGKLRRYFSWENLKDVFKVLAGIFQAAFKILMIRPDVTFSKGGFVSVPVIIGSWINRVPSITHESDLTPGLANKINSRFVKKTFTTFPETERYIPNKKGSFLGPVIRESLKNGDRQKGLSFIKAMGDKPIILVMGGSLGATSLNKVIRENLKALTEKYYLVHGTGKNGLTSDPEILANKNYIQFEYINDELKDVLSATDLVISRSGSNAIFEFLYYKLPMLLIPLSAKSSRGDQIENAKSFENQGFAKLLQEEDITGEKLMEYVDDLYENRAAYKENMKAFDFDDSLGKILDEIRKY